MTALPASPATPLPAIDRNEAAQVPCHRCEYSLRGLPREGNCPECGSPIEASWHRFEIEQAGALPPLHTLSPAFLRRIGWGCVLVAAAPMLTVLWTLCALLFESPWSGPAKVVAMGVTFMALAGAAAGLWMLGTREPSAARQQGSLRWIIRAGAVLEPLDMISMVLLMWVAGSQTGRWWGVRVAILSLASAIVTFAAWRRVAQLARRGDAPFVARSANLLSWLWPPLMLIQMIAFSGIAVSSYQTWSIHPKPMTGYVAALALFPWSLWNGVPFRGLHVLWALLVALTVFSIVLLAIASRTFSAAAAVAASLHARKDP